MNAENRCPACNADLPANAPRGLCPACLLKGGLTTAPDPGDASRGDDFVPPTPEQLAPLFPDLEILELVGCGGMGVVYKARQKRLDRFVALKILSPKIGRDPAFAERFAREARAMAMLGHPHIVAVHDFGQTNAQLDFGKAVGKGDSPPATEEVEGDVAPKGTAPFSVYYFLMEFVDGVNLRRLLDTQKLSPDEALAIVPQICDALQFAHNAGVVHRDIKPENILLDKNGQVKIADFGLAKLTGRAAKDFTLTDAGQVMGTPHYMAPEQFEHPTEVDHRADIYSLGVVFYQMLTGELPIGRFAPPSKRVQVDVRLDEIVLRALEKEPELRYQQASEFKTQVETIATTPGPGGQARGGSASPSATGSASAVPAARRTDWRAWVMGVGVRDGRKVINWPVLLVQWFLLFAVLCGIWIVSNPLGSDTSIFPGFLFLSAIFVVFIAWVQSSRSVEQLPSLDNTGPVWTIAARLLFGGVLSAHAIAWWFGSRDIAAIRLRAPWSLRHDQVGAVAIGVGLVSLAVAAFLVKKRNLVRTIVSLVVVGLILLVAVMFSQMLAVRDVFSSFERAEQAASGATGSASAVPATAVDVAQKPGGSWTAPLDVGEIELVAVSRHPSKDEPWWRPDGSPYTEKPFDTSGGRFTVTDPTVRHYEFVFRLPEGASIDSRGSSEPRGLGGRMGGGGGSLGADSRGSWGGGGTLASDRHSGAEYQYRFAAFLESADTVDFDMAVATAPWTIVATHGPTGSSTVSGFRVDAIQWTISFGPAIETAEGDLVIAVAHNEPFRDTRVVASDSKGKVVRVLLPFNRDTRVVAIDIEGKEHSPVRSEGLGLGNVRQLTFQKLPLARVKEFQLQSRPYRVVEFRNVVLRPKPVPETAEPSATGSIPPPPATPPSATGSASAEPPSDEAKAPDAPPPAEDHAGGGLSATGSASAVPPTANAAAEVKSHAAASACVALARAERPSFGERLLPNTTRGIFLVTNVDHLIEQWDQTQLGQLMADPVMEPFATDLRHQFQDRFSRLRDRLGLQLDDLRGVPSGEMDMAVVQHANDQAAVVLLVDATGNLPRAKEMLQKVSTNLKRKGATQRAESLGGLTLMVFDVPATPDFPKGHVAYFLSEDDGLLAAADHLDVIKDLVKRKLGQGAPAGALGDVTAFQKVMARCQQHASETVPQIRWFVDPIGYAECVRIMTPADKRRKGVVTTDVFRNQGFDAIKGIGGYLDFKVDQYELLHRTAVYAPSPYPKTPKPYVNKVGMEILTLPNNSDYSLPSFVPNDVATCTVFHWDLLKAFDNVGPTFNELFADKGDTTMFDDLIRDFEKDEFGPQINLRQELVKHLDHRIIVISDYILPITTKSERLLFAVKVRDAERVAAGIKKLFNDDPTIRKRKFEGLEIWETIEQEGMEIPSELGIDGLPDLAREKRKTPGRRERRLIGEDDEDKELLLPRAAVTVVHGHLLIASHYDYLVEILNRAKQPEPLSESMDFRTVASAMDALGSGDNFLRAFSRTEREYRPTYELIRQDKMPEADTMFGRMLNSLLGPHKPGVIREQKVDGKAMPDYQVVRRCLGPAGTFGRTEEEGWFVVGFMLKK